MTKDTRHAGIDRFLERKFVDPLRQQAHPVLPDRRYRDGHPRAPGDMLGAGGFGLPTRTEDTRLRAGEVPSVPRPIRSRTGDGFSNPDARSIWWLLQRPRRPF